MFYKFKKQFFSVGLDIGEHHLAFVKLSKNPTQINVEAYGFREIAKREDIPQTLTICLAEKNITLKDVYVTLPSKLSIKKN